MIGKITSEMISRRWALSLLGALGFVAAPTVLRPSNAEAQTAGAAPGRRKVALALQGGGAPWDRRHNQLGNFQTALLGRITPASTSRTQSRRDCSGE